VDHAVVVAIVVAAATGGIALLVPRGMRPDFAARLITALVMLSFGAALWALLIIVTGNVLQLHGVAERLTWCSDAFAHHRESFTPLGLAALGAVLITCASATRVRMRQRRQPTQQDDREIAIIASDQPVAFALPGQPGQVVVSTAMLESLDAPERRVLLAHERSHLRRRHHRYIRLTEFAVAALPHLAPLNARVRFAIERWADEDAADEVGDRALVASAIARAALASHSVPRVGLAIADQGVVERVESMLAGPSRRSPVVETLFSAALLAGVAGFVTSLVLIGPRALAVLGISC
jgi:Zn-dependent protease with chaperone function